MTEQQASFKDKLIMLAKRSGAIIKHPTFLKNLGILGLCIMIFFLVVSQWLTCYTNHGQKLLVPNFVDTNFEKANQEATDKSFELVIADSIFVLNEEPQMILTQNPAAGSKVKEGRKIYVTITKVLADLVNLPDLKGGNDDFSQYSRKLERLGITTKIVKREYSIKLQRNTILDVLFQGNNITDELNAGYKVPMGSIVEFVVSDRRGGTIDIPNLVCMNYEEASFLITSNNLNIGKISNDASVTNRSTAYVKRQVPSYSPSTSLDMGASIDLVLSQNPPEDCGGDDYTNKKKLSN